MNKNIQKITIITVTYNAEEFLERTIKNIIEQDYKNIEYIIIDGNSTDGTIDIIKKYEKYINHWISEPDNGLYDAMNKGIDIATGSWINFMNAGDMFCETDTISNVSKYFKNGNQIIYGDILRGENFNTYYKPKGLKAADNLVFVNHQGSFVKTKIMRKYHFNDTMKISSDYGFFHKCYKKGKKFKYIDIPIAKNLEGGISQVNNVKAWSEALYLQASNLEKPMDAFKSDFFKHLSNFPDNKTLFLQHLIKFFNDLEYKIDNKKFILYGFGTIGQLIHMKYNNNIIDIIDKNHETLTAVHNINIKNDDILLNKKEEYILIASFGYENEIKNKLLNQFKIKRDKIIEIEILR